MEFWPSFALVLQVYTQNKYWVAMVTAFSQVHPVQHAINLSYVLDGQR